MQGGRSRRLCIAAAGLAVAVADVPVFTWQMVLCSLNHDGHGRRQTPLDRELSRADCLSLLESVGGEYAESGGGLYASTCLQGSTQMNQTEQLRIWGFTLRVGGEGSRHCSPC